MNRAALLPRLALAAGEWWLLTSALDTAAAHSAHVVGEDGPLRALGGSYDARASALASRALRAWCRRGEWALA